MADNHSKVVRSKNMSHIRSTNTKPEEKARKYLFSKEPLNKCRFITYGHQKSCKYVGNFEKND